MIVLLPKAVAFRDENSGIKKYGPQCYSITFSLSTTFVIFMMKIFFSRLTPETEANFEKVLILQGKQDF